MRYIFSGQYSRFWLSIYQITAEKYFLFTMLITFEPKVAQRSVASQNVAGAFLPAFFFGASTALVPMCCKKVRVGGKYKPTHIMLGFQCCIRLIVTIKE